MPTNDNDPAGRGAIPSLSDAYGQAALLLVESLIHGLCENETLSVAEAVEIAERAVHVQADRAQGADGASGPMWQSHALLSAISASLKTDQNDGSPPLR